MNKVQYYGDKNIVHRRIKETRTAGKISQEELAARMQSLNVNMDQQMISKIEKNNRI
ncbi:helix-turn-helix domain-containing protein, partial [Anaerotruncus rubiinfantis]